MRIIEAMKESTLRLGYQGEDERTRVVFDLSDLIDEFGAGTVSLLVMRPWESEGSPVVISQGETTGQYYWDVTDADLQTEGSGAAQIVFVPTGHIAKTHIWKTSIAKSISESENPPEPWQGWVDQVLEAAAGIEQTAQEIPALIDQALQEAKDSGEFDGADGADGFSPLIEITDITGGHRISVTDASGTHTVDVMDGVDGADGKDGKDGTDGKDGADGADGQDGTDGTNGVDGYSPTVAVTDITGGHQVVITDKNGAHTFNIMDGVDGTNGTNGTDGSDGYSPTISVTDITGGHRLTITDVNGSRTVDVMDGDDAPGGTFYGTCSAVDSGTGVCTVGSSGYALNVGGIIVVAFSADVPQSATMNVASTGSKPISYKGSNVPAGIIKSGDRATFMYDGTNYVLMAIDHTASQAEVPYAICTDQKDQYQKSVSIAGVSSLFEGLTIRVKFINGLPANYGFGLNVNNLPSPEDAEITYIVVSNLPSGITAGAVVLELTLGSNSYGWNWFVIGAKFSSDPTPPNMGLGFYYEASTESRGGGPGSPVYSFSTVTVPSDFKVRDSQYRYGSLLVVHFDADVTDNGILYVTNETYSVHEESNISFRGANITNGVIKQGDTCLFTLRYNESTYANEWVLLSNDRWGVGVS